MWSAEMADQRSVLRNCSLTTVMLLRIEGAKWIINQQSGKSLLK